MKKRTFNEDLIASGFVLGIGASAIEKLPSSAAKTGVQSGLETAGKFYPTMVSVGMGGQMIKQLRELGRKKYHKRKNSKG